MSVLELHYSVTSPASRSVLMVAKELGLSPAIKTINTMAGESRTPEFKQINPQHTIPVLNDNGFVLQESRAIMEYLVEAYGKDDSLLPKDKKQRALVHSRLYFDASNLAPRFMAAYIVPFMTGERANEKTIAALDDSLTVLDTFLGDQIWAASPNRTVADYALVTTVTSIGVFEHDLSKYSNIQKWLSQCKKSMAAYDEVNQTGLNVVAAFLKSKKRS